MSILLIASLRHAADLRTTKENPSDDTSVTYSDSPLSMIAAVVEVMRK